MKVIGGIFLIITGCIMLIKPNTMWKIAESWKTKSKADASDLYIIIIRIAGFVIAIAGIIAILIK